MSDLPGTEQPKPVVAADEYYNPVFERLSAAQSGPLTGAVAYALYKNAKREWVKDFIKETKSRPEDADFKKHSATQTEAVLQAYISQADQILATFAQNVINEERPKIIKELLAGNFSRSFWPSFWASFAFTAILLAIVLIAAFLGFGFPVQITLPPRAGG